VRHLPGHGGEHVRRAGAAGHQRRHPAQRTLLCREDRVALPQHVLGPQPVLDVGERHDRPAALRHVDRYRDIRDREHRSVAPEEPVEVARDRLARRSRQQHWALGGRIRGPVRVPVVDRLVAVAPEKLVRAVIAERRDRGRVGEPDKAVGIHDPDRLRGCAQYSGEEILGADLPATPEIGY
jgi:hypothetical protein